MLLILPPSETKRDGGDPGRVLDVAALRFPSLTAPRRTAIAALRRVSRSVAGANHALRLGPSQRFEIDRNRSIGSSPGLPALARYTGVLYDALDAGSLAAESQDFAARCVVIHSAAFGLVGASDPIPAYRLSHDARLPGLRLATVWREPISRELASYDGLIVDLRSEAYVALGPAPHAPNSVYLRVVAAGEDGQRRAINHFNKKGKGAFLRAVLDAGIDHADVGSLLEWARVAGIPLRAAAPGEIELEVDQVVGRAIGEPE